MGNIGNSAKPLYGNLADGSQSFAKEIDESFFCWEPNEKRAEVLARLTREFWRSNAEKAVLTAAKGLSENLDILLASIRAIDLQRTLAPRLSARLSSLIESMERRDGYAVMDGIQAWTADPPESWYSTGLQTESIATHAWESSLLREVRSTQVSGVAALEFFPLLERDTSQLHSQVLLALERIGQVNPQMHAEIQSHVSIIKLFTGNGIEGLSSPKVFGALWLKAPTLQNAQGWFLEHLVHECSHLYLNAMLMIDPLLTNPQEINKAPIRPDPRPMFQILHGAFVLARNCRVHAQLDQQFPDLGLKPALDKFREQFQAGLDVLERHMQPTAAGQLLLDSFKQDPP